MASEPSDEAQFEPSPAERLRALELSGDPDARDIARRYKTSPLDGVSRTMREISRAQRSSSQVFEPTYRGASEADADEAEAAVAAMRAQREAERRKREEELHGIAKDGARREETMLRLTKASVALSTLGILLAGAALILALGAS